MIGSKPKVSRARAKSTTRVRRHGETTHYEPVYGTGCVQLLLSHRSGSRVGVLDRDADGAVGKSVCKRRRWRTYRFKPLARFAFAPLAPYLDFSESRCPLSHSKRSASVS